LQVKSIYFLFIFSSLREDARKLLVSTLNLSVRSEPLRISDLLWRIRFEEFSRTFWDPQKTFICFWIFRMFYQRGVKGGTHNWNRPLEIAKTKKSKSAKRPLNPRVARRVWLRVQRNFTKDRQK
jgi:hypothetical protein